MAKTLIYFEHEGSYYRGVSPAWPEMVWNRAAQAWASYPMGDEPKPENWGIQVTREQFEADKASD
jgi:hypothetical protein